MERSMKVFFILRFLLLMKSIKRNGNRSLNVTIKQCLTQCKNKDSDKLMADYENDIVLIQQLDIRTKPSNKKGALYENTVELIHLGQLKRMRQVINSSGCSDPTQLEIMEQMKMKFSKGNKQILTPIDEQLDHDRATIEYSILMETVSYSKSRVTADLGELRNEHLCALFFNTKLSTNDCLSKCFNSNGNHWLQY